MADMMTFPDTVEEFMEQYKITDTEQIYTNGTELVPIFRMRQWFDHKPEPPWIPGEKEMPKEKDAGVLQKIGIQNKSDIVFVTIDTEKGRMVTTACTWDGMWKWDGMMAFPKWTVTAWMPFPAPYQGTTQNGTGGQR